MLTTSLEALLRLREVDAFGLLVFALQNDINKAAAVDVKRPPDGLLRLNPQDAEVFESQECA